MVQGSMLAKSTRDYKQLHLPLHVHLGKPSMMHFGTN